MGQSQTWWTNNVGRLTGLPLYSPFAVSLTVATNQLTPAAKLQALRDLPPESEPAPRGCRDPALPGLSGCTDPTHGSLGRQADPVRGKYGKLVYRFMHGVGICVFAKYPHPVMVHPFPGLAAHTVLMRKLKK